jgi:hypothetical protein
MAQSTHHQQYMHHSVYLQPLLDKHGRGEGITFEDLQLSWKSLEQHCRNCQYQHQGKGHDKGKDPSTASSATKIKSPILTEMEALHKSLLDSYHATAKKYYTSILTNYTPPTLKPSAPRKKGHYAATSAITNPSSGSDSDSVASAFAAAEYISQNMSIIRPTLDKWSGIEDDKVDEWLWTPLKHKLHNAYKQYFLLEKRQRMKRDRADAEVLVVSKVVGRTKYLEEGHGDKKVTRITVSNTGTGHSRGSSNVNSMVNTPKAPNSTPTSTCGASTTIATNDSDANESLDSKINPSSEQMELELKVIKEEEEDIINNQTNNNVTNSNEEGSQQQSVNDGEERESHEENGGDGEGGSEREEDFENEDENDRDDGDGNSADGSTSIVNKGPTSTSTCNDIAPTTNAAVSTRSNTKKRTGMIAIGLNPPRKRSNSNLNLATGVGVGGTVTKRKRATNNNSNKNHNSTNNNNNQGQSNAAGSSSGGGGGGRGNNRKKPRNNRAKRGRGKTGGRGSTK